MSGLKIIDTAGDPPSHASLHVRSAKEDLLIGGDLLIHPFISFSKPEWRLAPIWNPTARSRSVWRFSICLLPIVSLSLDIISHGRERHESKGRPDRFATN